MNFDPGSIRNLVFDLGGVLYAIDPQRTAAALKALAGPKARPMAMDDPLFLALEMGTITPADFRAELRAAIDSQADDQSLDLAWNALLLGPIAGRIAGIKQLAERYRVILLSNTNVIHQKIWGPECAEMFGHMEKTWFSFDMGMRKPHAEIYEFVLREMGMKPSESLFLDDSAINLVGAEQIGMSTLLIDPLAQNQFSQFCLKFLPKD
jgi:glucose-1-phosphatase